MASTAVNPSFSWRQEIQRRNVSPDVPEDIDDHFNDPNWDYVPASPSATTNTFVEKRSSWSESFRQSDVEGSSQYEASGPSKLDMREVTLENE